MSGENVVEKFKQSLSRVLFHSAFGVTLLTMAAMALVFGFLIQGTHPISVVADDEEDMALAEQSTPARPAKPSRQVASAGTRITPSDRYALNRGNVLPRVAPGYVARLMRTQDCQWADDAEAPRDGTLLKVGQRLNVAAGLAEIAFACGAKAILEGPAVLELQSEKSSHLRTGRMTADVPDEVEGFTVHTPVAQVVSLCALESKPVARLTETANCRWATGNTASKKGAGLSAGQRVNLLEGLAEITFASGAKVLMQGPCVLEIETTKTAILHSGKLTADVPDDLEGFKIRTPVVDVVSLPSTDAKVVKGASKSKPLDVDSEDGAFILKAGEHARIEAAPPKPKAHEEKAPPASKAPPAKS